MLFPKEEDFDKVMDDIEALVGDVRNQVNKSNDIIEIMEKKEKSTKVKCPMSMYLWLLLCPYLGSFCVIRTPQKS